MRSPTLLRDVERDDEVRRAFAHVDDEGALVVEGRDVGPELQEWFGEDAGLYRWVLRIPRDQVPELMTALDRPGDDPIDAVAAWVQEDDRAFEPFLDAHGVVHESWSQVDA